MPNETYNGWTNRATWLVALHLNNTPESQEWATVTAHEAFGQGLRGVDANGFLTDLLADEDDARGTRARWAINDAGDAFELALRERLTVDPYSVNTSNGFADNLGAALIVQALTSVDWPSIVETFAEEAIAEELADA